jgi:hypothetical protein
MKLIITNSEELLKKHNYDPSSGDIRYLFGERDYQISNLAIDEKVELIIDFILTKKERVQGIAAYRHVVMHSCSFGNRLSVQRISYSYLDLPFSHIHSLYDPLYFFSDWGNTENCTIKNRVVRPRKKRAWIHA